MALPSAASAMEGGQSPYLKGVRDLMTGVLPPPGVLLRNDTYLYTGTESSTVPQGKLGVRLNAYTDVLAATVTTRYRVLGGHFGFAARFAGSDVTGERSLTRPRGTTTVYGHLTSYNDMVLTPAIIGWHNGPFHWNVSISAWLPVGSYDKDRLVNIGKNAWALSPQIGITYFDPQSGWEVSAAGVYVVSFENTATHYRSGDIVHVDYAVARQISPQFKIGVVGYFAEQITADSGTGATLGDRKLRVGGIGPALAFTFAVNNVPMTVVAKFYREFNAQNTTQGDAASLSTRIHF